MLNPVQVKLEAATASLALFDTNKRASTALLTKYTELYNARAPRTELNAALRDYIAMFNTLTDNAKRLRDDMAALAVEAAAQTVSLENFSAAQVDEMKNNPQQYFAAGYLTLVNSLLFFPREQGLALVDSIGVDMRKDINDAWNDEESGVTPEVPRTSVVFESDHALDMVRQHLADVELPSPEDDQYPAEATQYGLTDAEWDLLRNEIPMEYRAAFNQTLATIRSGPSA